MQAGEAPRANEVAWELLSEIESIYRNAPVGLCVLDIDLRFVRINARLAEINGLPAEAHIGRTVREVVPHLADQAEPLMQRVLQTGEAMIDVEIWGETSAQPGVRRTWIESWIPLKAKDGRIIGLNGVTKEITNQKKIESSLIQKNRILRGINQIYQKALTCKTEEELGGLCLKVAEELTCSRFGLIGELTPEDRMNDLAISDPGWEACKMGKAIGHRIIPGGFKVHGIYGRVLRDGKGFYTNDPASHPDSIGLPQGHPVLQSFLGVPLIQADKTIGVLSVANRPGGYQAVDLDTLEMLAPTIVQALMTKRAELAQRQSEERYRSLFESIDEGFCIIEMLYDDTGRPVDFLFHETNPAFEKKTGLHSAVGKRMRELDPNHEAHWFETYGRIASSDEPVRFMNYAQYLGNRWYEVCAFRIGCAEERKIAMLFNDVTDRKQSDDALRRLNATLEARVAERTAQVEARSRQLQILAIELIEAEERERRRIAELLHDDLQQLLAAAKLHLQMVFEHATMELALEKVDQLLEESIRKARGLSHELSPPVLYQAGLDEALGWLARQMNVQFGLKVELEIAVEIIESIPLRAFIFRAAKELLFNITKHAGVGLARVALSSSGNNLVLVVSDQGKGFDLDILESTKALHGLGLLSIRERARHIGGNLKIESALGKGSCFTLEVPLAMAEESPAPVALPGAKEAENRIEQPVDYDAQVSRWMRGVEAAAYVSETTSASELLEGIYRIAHRQQQPLNPSEEKKAPRPTQLKFPWPF